MSGHSFVGRGPGLPFDTSLPGPPPHTNRVRRSPICRGNPTVTTRSTGTTGAGGIPIHRDAWPSLEPRGKDALELVEEPGARGADEGGRVEDEIRPGGERPDTPSGLPNQEEPGGDIP